MRGRELGRREVVEAHARRIAERNPALGVERYLEALLERRALARRVADWVNLVGLPAVALGGTQIVARRFHDRDALRAARDCLGGTR